MFQLVAAVLTWLFWFGSTALVIRIDGQRQRALAQASGEVDFLDRSLTPYLILAVFCGALPLLMYFKVTRKGVRGGLIGLGAFVTLFVATVIVSTVLMLVAKPLDAVAQRQRNLAYGLESCGKLPPEYTQREWDACYRSIHDYQEGTDVDPRDPARASELAGAGCDSGRFWACEMLLGPAAGMHAPPAADAAKWKAKEKALCKEEPNIDPACTHLLKNE